MESALIIQRAHGSSKIQKKSGFICRLSGKWVWPLIWVIIAPPKRARIQLQLLELLLLQNCSHGGSHSILALVGGWNNGQFERLYKLKISPLKFLELVSSKGMRKIILMKNWDIYFSHTREKKFYLHKDMVLKDIILEQQLRIIYALP